MLQSGHPAISVKKNVPTIASYKHACPIMLRALIFPLSQFHSESQDFYFEPHIESEIDPASIDPALHKKLLPFAALTDEPIPSYFTTITHTHMTTPTSRPYSEGIARLEAQ
jgi:hypothetical protein